MSTEGISDTVYNMVESGTSTPEIVIVADDLTGALDSAVGFAGEGRRVIAARRIAAVPEALSRGPDVLVVNTASRELTESDARARIRVLGEYLDLATARLVMKKVDSRLKGHVAAETAELASLVGAGEIAAAPAIPDMGRIVGGGFLSGAGIEAPIDVNKVMEGGARVFDASCSEDLDRAVLAMPEGTLWVGARGLAFALAGAGIRRRFRPVYRPLILAIGSRDPITKDQVAALGNEVETVEAPNGQVPKGTVGSAITAICMSEGVDAIAPRLAGDRFAEGVVAMLASTEPMTLLACGGETANAVLEKLGADVLEVVAELYPGVPVCEWCAKWGRMHLITKSGGFGAPDLLRRVVRLSRERDRQAVDGECL